MQYLVDDNLSGDTLCHQCVWPIWRESGCSLCQPKVWFLLWFPLHPGRSLLWRFSVITPPKTVSGQRGLRILIVLDGLEWTTTPDHNTPSSVPTGSITQTLCLCLRQRIRGCRTKPRNLILLVSRHKKCKSRREGKFSEAESQIRTETNDPFLSRNKPPTWMRRSGPESLWGPGLEARDGSFHHPDSSIVPAPRREQKASARESCRAAWPSISLWLITFIRAGGSQGFSESAATAAAGAFHSETSARSQSLNKAAL